MRIRCLFLGHLYGNRFNNGGFNVCSRCKYQPIKPRPRTIRPWLTERDREMIRAGTAYGNLRLLQFSWAQLCKAFRKAFSFGYG